jgi:hypothetical protein
MKTVVPCGRSSVRRALCGLAFLFAGAASPALAQYSSLTTNGTLGTGTFTMNASSGLGRGYSGTAFGNTATLSSGTINLTGTSTLNLGFGFDILLVGGGGAGGSTGTSTTTANGAGSIFAGGGGGGGYLYASNVNTSVVGGTASITVGAGGVAGTGGSAQNGGAGGATSFVFGSGTYRAGGGGGGSGASAAGAGTAGIGTNGSAAAGGSGGGGSWIGFAVAGGAAATGGFAGGAGDARTANPGGGAAGSGTAANGSQTGGGGVGSNISGYNATYGAAGGGGAGPRSNSFTGSGEIVGGAALNGYLLSSRAAWTYGTAGNPSTFQWATMVPAGSAAANSGQGGGGGMTPGNGTTGTVSQAVMSVGGNGGSGVAYIQYFASSAQGTGASGTTVINSTGRVTQTFSGVGTSDFALSTSATQTSNKTVTLSSQLTGAGRLRWDSSGTLQLTGSNSQTGVTEIARGTLVATSAAAFGTGTIQMGGGNLVLATNAGRTFTKDILLSAAADSSVISTQAAIEDIQFLMVGGGGGGPGGDVFVGAVNVSVPTGGSGGGSSGQSANNPSSFAAAAGGLGASFASGTGNNNAGGTGGGGAGGQGTSALGNDAGPFAGGVGLSNSITNTAVTYAAGGSGGAGNGSDGANGTSAGSGGGGAGGSNTASVRNNGGNGANGTIVIRYTSGSSLGSLSGAATMTTSTVSGTIIHQISGSNAAGTFTVNARAGDVTLAGVLSGTGGLWFNGTAGGDLATSMLTLSNSNSFNGQTKVDSGILRLTNRDALRESTLAIGTGTVRLGSLTALNIGGVASGGTLALTNESTQAVTLGRVATGTVAGVLAGLGGITHEAGTLRLEGANTYAGNTLIRGGTVQLGAAGSIANSGTVNVGDAGSSGARLDLSANSAYTFGTGQTVRGIGSIAGGGVTTVTIAGVLSPGNSPGLLTFDNANLVLDSTANTLMEITGTTLGSQYDAVVLAGGTLTYGGTLTLDFGSNLFTGGTFNLFEFKDAVYAYFDTVIATGSYYSGTFTKDISSGTGVYTLSGMGGGGQQLKFTDVVPAGESSNFYGQLVIVPEPVTLGLLGIASGVIVLAVRRRAARIQQHAARTGDQPDDQRA